MNGNGINVRVENDNISQHFVRTVGYSVFHEFIEIGFDPDSAQFLESNKELTQLPNLTFSKKKRKKTCFLRIKNKKPHVQKKLRNFGPFKKNGGKRTS